MLTCSRTQVFFYIQMLLLVTELVAIPLAARFMERLGPNETMAVTIPIGICAIPILHFIKETLVHTEEPDSSIYDESESVQNAHSSIWKRAKARIVDGVNTTHAHLVSGALPLLRRRVLLLALAGFFVNRLTRPVLSLLLQYASVKFSLRISQVSGNCAHRLVHTC